MLSGGMNNAPTYDNGRARGPFEDDDNHLMDPARRALLERDDLVGSSPRSDDRMKGLERRNYSPPQERRVRIPSTDKSRHGRKTKRARLWREKSRSGSRSTHSERAGSAELLPRMSYQNSGDGRLSYWDDGYNDVEMSNTVFPEQIKRLVPDVYQLSDSLGAEIQRMYPDADLTWISDMAGFDVDEFFHGLEDRMIAVSTPQHEEDARMEMNIFDDEDDGQIQPTVRLPPAQETSTDALSDRKRSFYDDQQQSSLDGNPRRDDTEERSWYGFQVDKDVTSRMDNSEIVVKLPQGIRKTLNMERFSANLKVNPPNSDDLNSETNREATNANSQRPLKDTLSISVSDDGGQNKIVLPAD